MLQPNGASGLVSLRRPAPLVTASQREPCRNDVPPVQMRCALDAENVGFRQPVGNTGHQIGHLVLPTDR